MILIINYQKIKDKIIGKKNAKTTQQVLIAKFTKANINSRRKNDPFEGLFFCIFQSIPYKYQKFDDVQNELLSKYFLFGSRITHVG